MVNQLCLRYQLTHQLRCWHDLDAAFGRKCFRARISGDASRGTDIIGRIPETASHLGCSRPLDLDGPDISAGEFQNEVAFSAATRSIETRTCTVRRGHDRIFDDEAFVASANDRMPKQCVARFDPEKRMHDPAVTKIDLG